MKHRFYLTAIGILILVIILQRGCDCTRPKPKPVVKTDTIERVKTVTVTVEKPVTYTVKGPKEVVYRDTGRVVIDSFGYFIVPDSLTDAIITDYYSSKYYDTTFKGDGWAVRKKDTVFQNTLYGSGLTVSVREKTVTNTVNRPPRREGFIGATGAYWPGSISFGPSLHYKDKRGRLFSGAVMAGPNGLVYQAGVSIKISFTKKM